jgi:hypothetical protein
LKSIMKLESFANARAKKEKNKNKIPIERV